MPALESSNGVAARFFRISYKEKQKSKNIKHLLLW